MKDLRARTLKCPFCGQNDPSDDDCFPPILKEVSYNRDSLVLEEDRVCDICRKSYRVRLHYNFSYEEYEGETL